MKLRAFAHGPLTPELRPARARRDWMDAFPDRHAYRCLPLAIANGLGWELLCPCDLVVEYDGGDEAEAIRIFAEDDYPLVDQLAASNFTRGIVTFHTGYIFRTEPGWSLMVGGPANDPKDGVAPLSGLVETDWLPYPFTMNYQLTRAGRFRFRKSEPYCLIVPVAANPIVASEIEILDIAAEPGLRDRMTGLSERRDALLSTMRGGAHDVPHPAWGREYFRGILADGTAAPRHMHKLRMAEPIDRRSPATDRVRRPIVETMRLGELDLGTGRIVADPAS